MMKFIESKDMAAVAMFILAVIINGGVSQDANCDFSVNMVAGQRYSIQKTFTAGNTCRWIAISPSGYNSRVDCTVNIAQTTGCAGDRLLISRSGDPQLTGAESYCGRGTVTATSTGTRISMGLIATANSGGGNIACTFYAQAATTSPNTTCSCGYAKNDRIVGGTDAGINQFPSMVGVVDSSISTIFCGAVIISERYILTAGHCMLNRNLSQTAVVVGEHDVTIGDSPATRVYRISSVLIHPQFTTSNYDYDAAIIMTSTTIAFSGLVGPICLPFKYVNTDYTGAKVQALGWGTIAPGAPVSDVLLKVTLDVISQNQCRSTVSTLTNRQLCTLTPNKDACQYDSGGPLIYTDPSNGRMYNLGIISFGFFCAESGVPAVNTRVTNSEIIQWIVSNTPSANYCRI